MFKRLSVKTKFTLLLILVAYSSVLLVGLMSYTVGKNIINKRVDAELTLTTQSIMDSVDKLIYDRYNDMQLLISDSTLSDPNASISKKTDVLRTSLIQLGWYDNLYLTDSRGTIVSSTYNKSLKQNINNETWFQLTQENFIHVSDVTTLPFRNKKSLIFSNTLMDSENQIIGYVFAEFSLQVIEDLLKNTSDDVEVYLLSQFGDLIAEKNLNREEQFLSKLFENFFLAEIGSKVVEGTTNKDVTKSGYITHKIRSDGYLGFSGNEWSLVVQIPRAIAYAPLREFSLLLWLIVLMISFEVILLGQLVARRFVKPIYALTQGVARIQKGDLTQKIPVNTYDEIGYLATNFNSMTESLAEKTNKLMAEKGKYKSILESTDEGIILFNSQNQVIAYNRTFVDLFNYDYSKAPSGIEVFNYLNYNAPDAYTEQNFKAIRALFETNDFKNSINLEIQLQEPEFRILKLYSKPVLTEEGELLGRIWIYNNVTEERQAEKDKIEFIRTASHKLRTPLTAINWTLEMYQDSTFGTITDEQKEALQQIDKNTERLNELVEMLLEVAEIDKNHMKLKSEVINLGQMIQGISKKAFKHLPTRANTHIDMPNLAALATLRVKGDTEKIEQVLRILLDNAYLYGEEPRENRITLTATVDQATKKATIKISDTGMGISKEEQGKIFSKFFRGEKAPLIHTEGTGLNLYLVKTIIESSKEKIWFESTEGLGSSFYFTLPLA